MGNNTLKEIGKVLLDAEGILLLPHINADGDALGSSMALCKSLRKMGKKCQVVTEEKVPEYLSFLDNNYSISYDEYEKLRLAIEEKSNNYTDINTEAEEYCEIISESVCYLNEILSRNYTAVWIDCSGRDRTPNRSNIFDRAAVTVCIDHHKTSVMEANFNHIDPQAGATGELIYTLLKEIKAPMDKEIGEALFTALTTDTGNFQYSNTTKKTFEIVVALMDLNIEISRTSNLIYQNCPLAQIVINNKVLETMKIIAGGKGAIAFVTNEMLKDADAKIEHTEGVINTLRSIKGIEIAAFLKEIKKDIVKVTMRAKSHADVAAICTKYGGGGHTKAAGCTLEMSVMEAKTLIIDEIEIALSSIN